MINPKFSFWFGVFVTALLFVGSTALPAGTPYADTIQAWAKYLALFNSAILTALHGLSSSQAGPLTGGNK